MWDFTDTQQGALRYEYVDDTEGLWLKRSSWSLTYTQNMTVGNHIKIRPEIRYNHYNVPSDEEVVFSTFGGPGGESIVGDNELIVGVGVEYVF